MVTEQEWKDLVASLSAKMKVDYLKNLFVEKSETFFPVLSTRVAAKGHHHAYIGGLLQHTYEMLKSFDVLLETGLYSKVNVDYVAIAVLYHDMAKVYEYKTTQMPVMNPTTGQEEIVYSTECTEYISLVGHIYGSTHILEGDLSKIKEVTQSDKNNILHCILSHHGRKDWGALMEPKTTEAFMICQLDMLSAKCAAN